MNRTDLGRLDPTRTWWVAAVVSPERDWTGAPGCRRGARFLVDAAAHASRAEFEPFDSHSGCLRWIMAHRGELNRSLPRARVRAVPLDRWLLGLE